MSRELIQTWKITCDKCNVSLVLTGTREALPQGWDSRWFDMSYRRDYCPICLEIMATQKSQEEQP